MTLTLHLGVIDVPYSEFRVGRRRPLKNSSKTTGDVAEILEDKYHVMEIFAAENEQFIADALADGLEGALESLLMGAPPSLDPFGTGTSKIDGRFKEFLSLQEIEKLGYPGVPTQAALRGVNHRLKRPYLRSNPRRPSFIDTGLYQASEKSWVTND
jgi:hypothetical protein